MGAEGRWRDLGFVDCAEIKQSQPILRASLLLNALEINIEHPGTHRDILDLFFRLEHGALRQTLLEQTYNYK